MQKFLVLALFSLGLVAQAASVKVLDPLTTFGPYGDGSLPPPQSSPYPPVSVGTATTGYQRGYAYDPTTGTTVLVDPNTGSTANANFAGGIYVIDGVTGQVVSTLSTNGIFGGTYSASALGVGDDGVVYLCNQINNNSQTFLIYSWANVWQSNTAPYLAFSNTITANQRYGATMAVRGSGTGTQIIIGSKIGTTGTNVVLFSTADGVNFSASVLSTGVAASDFADGIAFGAGNTFWAKSVAGHPLRLMSFNPATSNATTLASFDTNAMPASFNLGPLAVDVSNKLLASIEVIGTTGGGQRVWLYDISGTLTNPAVAPALLDIRFYAPNHPFASAPNGFLSFGGGNLYTHAINNGLLSFAVNTAPMPAPIITNQPGPATKRIVVGQSFRAEVLAYPAVSSYRWLKNGTNYPNATNAVLNIINATTNDSGTYSVVVSNAAPGSALSSNIVLTVVTPSDLYHLNPLWSVSPTAGAAYFNSTGGSGTPNQRTIAYNALSNELYVVSRASSSSAAFRIYALPATNINLSAPPILKWLNTNGISGGTIGLIAIGCSDDGSIYACNMDTTGAWKLYRWANSDSNTVPLLVYGPADPFKASPHRVGDVMHVRGGGLNTQIIIDNQDTGSARYVSVLQPGDAYLTNFVSTVNVVESSFANAIIGRSIQWASSTNTTDYTFWQKHYGATLVQSTFDPSADNVLAVSNAAYGVFPATSAAVWVDAPHNLVFAFKTNNASTPHSLELYDYADPTSPISIASYSFPANPPVANANAIAQIVVSGNYVFAISGNNGILAYQLASGPPTAPGFLAQPQNLRLILGGTGSMSVVADQAAAYQWRKDGSNLSGGTLASYTISNAQFTNAGSYTCVLSNQYGMNTSAVALVTVTAPSNTYSLSPVWATAPNSGQVYATTNGGVNSPNERSIAYNALSNQLIVVQCPVLSTSFSVYVLDADTGILLYTLNTNGIVHEGSSEVSGQNPVDLLSVAVADDGAIYICNESPNASGGSGSDPTKMFRIYCWTNSDPATTPMTVYMGDPANQSANYRWGDSLAVRGSGANTEIIADAGTGTYAAILKPTDASRQVFTNAPFTESYPGSIGRSLQFGPTNTYWLKRKALPLQFQQYNLTSQLASTLNVYSQLPATMAGITLATSQPLAAGVDYIGNATNTPDAVALFEVSDWNSPMLIARYSFPANQFPNANFIGQTVFAGNKVFALDGNNGIMAFTIQAPSGNSPSLAIALSGSNVILSWPTNYTGFTLKSTATLVTPITWGTEGTGTVSGAQYFITNSAAGSKFYRLEK